MIHGVCKTSICYTSILFYIAMNIDKLEVTAFLDSSQNTVSNRLQSTQARNLVLQIIVAF